MVTLSACCRVLVVKSVYVFLLLALALFSVGGYRWAFKINRTQPQTINPVMYPHFTPVTFPPDEAAHIAEPYYRLWRTYDHLADGYAPQRVPGQYHRVPVLYVHGNGGSFYCARSMARFVYEANVRRRERALQQFRTSVKERLYHLYADNASLAPLEEGETVPAWLQQQAERAVLLEEVPLLAAELFSVDYLEESYTQSGAISIKEARYLNHSLHRLMRGFNDTFAAVLDAKPDEAFDAQALAGDEDANEGSDGRRRGSRATFNNAVFPLPAVTDEYQRSLCRHPSKKVKAAVCARAEEHLARFSSLERVQHEVRRVQQRGLWIWAESMGGSIAIATALMNPSLIAGVVLVGSPVHYPPLLFDTGSTQFFRALTGAVLRHYPLAGGAAPPVDWEGAVLPHDTPLQLLRQLEAVSTAALAERVRDVAFVTINGGALDDIVPSISAYVTRSVPRAAHGAAASPPAGDEESRVCPNGAYRRDLSTEGLRGCAVAMDHRGIVYGLQFLRYAAESLVDAALLPDANAHLGRNDALPMQSSRDRLFPSVVETLRRGPRGERDVADKFLFSAGLNDYPSGGYVKEKRIRVLTEKFHEICVDTPEALDVNDLPVHDEARGSGYYDASRPLHVMMGTTTLEPSQVYLPSLQLFAADGSDAPLTELDFRSEAATRLHLPTMVKGSKPQAGRNMRTAFSFNVRRVVRRRNVPWMAFARFCFLVRRDDRDAMAFASRHKHFVQYSRIDPRGLAANTTGGTARRHLGPHFVGNALQVQHGRGFALVTGVDAMTLETRLRVRVGDKSAVYPVVMAGSLHSFYQALRGSSDAGIVEPDEQIQYFYGPFVRGTTLYNYSWKVFSTYPDPLESVYMVYVLGDVADSVPEIELGDLEMLASPASVSVDALERLRWYWADYFPDRWLAHFSVYSGIGKLGGSYVLVFFTYVFFFGLLPKKFYRNPQLRVPTACRVAEALYSVNPVWGALVLVVLTELLMGSWTDYALKICRAPIFPPGTINEELTASMGAVERLTLVLLFWLRPAYEACHVSWVRIQSVPVWSCFTEHVLTIYVGFVFAGILLIVSIIVGVAAGIVSFPHNRLVLRPLIASYPRIAAVLYMLLWLSPTLFWAYMPQLPVSYVTIVSPIVAQSVMWVMPTVVRPGYSFWWPCAFMCMGCYFPAHFDGLVLTIRNAVLLRETPAALADPERTMPSARQLVIYGLGQLMLSSVYITSFAVSRHEAGMRRLQMQKEEEARERTNGEVSKPNGSKKTNGKSTSKSAASYQLGDFGRRFRRLHTLFVVVRIICHVFMFYASLVAMRRPLECDVTVVGNLLLLTYGWCFLASRW